MTDVPVRITCGTCSSTLRLLPPDVEVVSCRVGAVARYRCEVCDRWSLTPVSKAHLTELAKVSYPVRYVYVPPPDLQPGWPPLDEDEVLGLLAEMHAGLVTLEEDAA